MTYWWAGSITSEAILLHWMCGEIVQARNLLGVRHVLSEAVSFDAYCGHLVGHPSLNCVSLLARGLVNLRTLNLLVDDRVLVNVLVPHLLVHLVTGNLCDNFSRSHWRVDHFCPRWLEENFLGRQMLTRLLDPLGGAVLDWSPHVLGRRG